MDAEQLEPLSMLGPSLRTSVLLVDRNPNLCRAVSIGLKLDGFRTSQAPDGASALAMLDTIDFDYVVIDLLMPDMSGLELARRIQKVHPSIRILLTSEYEVSSKTLSRQGLPEALFLQKPFLTEQLAAILKQ